MMKYIFIALVCMFAVASAQDNRDVLVIDPFEVDGVPVIIVLTGSDSFPVCADDHIDSSTIIGGERGIQFCATQGAANSVLTAGVSDGSFACASPANAGGEALLQYDGVDGTLTLNAAGLNSAENDFTAQGGFGLKTVVNADFTTTAEIRVYSGSAANFCSATITIPGGDFVSDVLVEYIDFSNVGTGCDFANVGAFEFEVQVGENVDVVIDQISVVGPLMYDDDEECVCYCPEFTCLIVLDRDDDGFVYYATSDFNPDDDDDAASSGSPASPGSPGSSGSSSSGSSSSGSSSSGSSSSGSNSGSSSSSASALTASVAVIAIAIVALVL